MDLNQDALTAAHVAVEDELIWMRDDHISMPFHANGFVVRNYDGTDSSIMRFGTRHGLEIGIKAYLKALSAKDEYVDCNGHSVATFTVDL